MNDDALSRLTKKGIEKVPTDDASERVSLSCPGFLLVSFYRLFLYGNDYDEFVPPSV